MVLDGISQPRNLRHQRGDVLIEVNSLHHAKPNQLSRYLQRVLGLPLAYDVMHTNGLPHRLDIPSSGLVLVAKTYAAYYDLQLQLSVGDLVRDYVVLCHGLLPSSCQEINERVYFWPHEGISPGLSVAKENLSSLG